MRQPKSKDYSTQK